MSSVSLTAPRATGMWSRLLALACLALAIALPIGAMYHLLSSPPQVLLAQVGMAESFASSFGAAHRALMALIGVAPVGCMSVALLYARGCFLSFARGEYFKAHVVHGLRRCAGWMFLSSLAGLLAPPLISVLLSAFSRGPGTLSVHVTSSQLLLMLFSGVVWQIAIAMSKAVVLADEHAQFI